MICGRDEECFSNAKNTMKNHNDLHTLKGYEHMLSIIRNKIARTNGDC
jgi:hypothetical protein